MRRNAFVLTSTHFGPMLASRLDYSIPNNGQGLSGIGLDLMEMDEYRRVEVDTCFDLIKGRMRRFGRGVIVLDVGANIGTHTISWARRMHEWGTILAIEAQEFIFYALAGNIVLNNCFNARAMWGAAASKSGEMDMPSLDYSQSASFGSLALKKAITEHQPKAAGSVKVPTVAIDDLSLHRLDFLKIDVEGMEMDVLEGARETIKRLRPTILVEANSTLQKYAEFAGSGYACREFDDMNVLMEPM